MVQTAEFQRASSYSEDRASPSPPRYSPPTSYSRPSSSRLSPFVGSYSNCNSIDELCDRFSRYHRQVRGILDIVARPNVFHVSVAPLTFCNKHPSTFSSSSRDIPQHNENLCSRSSLPVFHSPISCHWSFFWLLGFFLCTLSLFWLLDQSVLCTY